MRWGHKFHSTYDRNNKALFTCLTTEAVGTKGGAGLSVVKIKIKIVY
jgi:hypothetical protein